MKLALENHVERLADEIADIGRQFAAQAQEIRDGFIEAGAKLKIDPDDVMAESEILACLTALRSGGNFASAMQVFDILRGFSIAQMAAVDSISSQDLPKFRAALKENGAYLICLDWVKVTNNLYPGG